MKPTTLTVASLLTIVLLPFHIAGDIALGFDRGGSGLLYVVVPLLLVLACGALLLAERRSGHVIMFLVGLLAAAIPVMHMRGSHYPEIAASAGGFFFVWTLWALGGLGGVTMILAVRGLWGLRRAGTRH